MKRIVHISDLHFGRTHYPTLEALQNFMRAEPADLVVVSGDITQRSRTKQFQEAKEFLGSLPSPKFVVPGNHDIPLYKIWMRFWNPFKNYRRLIHDDVEPIYVDDEIAVLGLNTISLWKAEGYFSTQRLEKLQERFEKLPPNLIRILVSHHPLPSYRIAKAQLDFDVFLSGHTHEANFAVAGIKDHRRHLKIEAGTGTSTRLRGGLGNSFNLIEVESPHLSVVRFEWDPLALDFKKAERGSFRLSETKSWQGSDIISR